MSVGGEPGAPLSLTQQRLWYIENFSPDTAFNHGVSVWRVAGVLDAAVLQRAVQAVVDHQPALRTRFAPAADGVRQHVRDRVDVPQLVTQPTQGDVQDTITALRAAPLDLAGGVPFRVALLRDGDHHLVVLVVHHLVWDAPSSGLFAAQLGAAVAAIQDGRAPAFAPLTLTAADAAGWQAEMLAGDAVPRHVAPWREALSPLPEPLALATDRPRPVQMTGRSHAHRQALAPDLVDALVSLSRSRHIALPTLLLAACAVLVRHMSGQDELVVACPVTGRDDPALSPVMGNLADVRPLRLHVDRDLPFDHWVTSVQRAVDANAARPAVPFEHLVHALGLPHDPTRPVLAQLRFEASAPKHTPAWGAWPVSPFDADCHAATHDLDLRCELRDGAIDCVMRVNADILDAATAPRFLARFQALLRQVAAAPSSPVADLSLLDDTDRQWLDRHNATDTPFDLDTTVPTLLAASASRHRDGTALTQPGIGAVTHGELDRRANQLARLLRARGIGRGQLVGLCVDRGIEMVVAQLAILKAGAAYVPLDPAYPADRLAYMAEDARLALLVTESALVHAIDWPRARSVLVDVDAAAIVEQPAGPLPADRSLDPRPDDPAYVIYTSGSTGKPKGVMVPHRAVVNFLHAMAQEPGLTVGDRLVAVTTLSFDIAVLELLLPLAVGAEAVLASRDTTLDSLALRELVESTEATVMQATPSTWRLLVASGWQGHAGFRAFIGGEALPGDLAAQLLERTGSLWNLYGPTETTVWSTCWRVTDPDRIVVGHPIANTRVHVLDDCGRPCAPGVPGELWIAGEGVTLGYLRRPELTAERFLPDPHRPGATMYRTGDRGRWRLDGELEHLGRLDFQVKVRGYRIELGEIENNLATHPQVAHAIVIVREDSPGDSRLVAYVVPRGEAPSADALRTHLRATLPEHMLPQHVLVLDTIPLLPNGKTDRHALPAPSTAAAARPRDRVAPKNPAEVAIAEIWSRLIGVPTVDTTDNFFDLGGHSLLAMRAVLEIEQRLGVRLSVRRLIFESLGQIAGTLDTSGTRSGSGDEPPTETTADGRNRGLWGRLVGAFRASP